MTIIDRTLITPTDPMVRHCGTCGRPVKDCTCGQFIDTDLIGRILKNMVKAAQQHADKAQR